MPLATATRRFLSISKRSSGLNQKEIAEALSVHPSTISRELKKNRDKVRGYSAELAQIRSTKKHKEKPKRGSLNTRPERSEEMPLGYEWLNQTIFTKEKRVYRRL